MQTSTPATRPAPGIPTVLMVGKGWFPDELGGLDRYFRALLEHLPEARGIVVGSIDASTPRVTGVSLHHARLTCRLRLLFRELRRQLPNADLVDVHFALYAVVPAALGYLRAKPLVVHFQGPWADENLANGDLSGTRLIVRRVLERTVYRQADILFVLTGAFRRVLVERYGISPWDVVVEPPGVDTARFTAGGRADARIKFGIPADAFVVCCVRRLVPRMGIELLVEAWEDQRLGGPPARLLIAGDGEMREPLLAEVARRGYADSVQILGRLTDEELVALYQAADVNVIPSLSFEGYGLVCLEAAACGTPSIGTNVGGLPEALAGLDDDLVVPPGDAAALAARIARARAGQIPTREATAVWAQTHQWAQVAQVHREQYTQLLSGRSERPRKLRVIYLNHIAQLSGGELALMTLISALRDVDAHVILGEGGPLADRLTEMGISVEVLPLRRRTLELRKDNVSPGRLPWQSAYDTLTYAVKLTRRLRRLQPDVVHSNSLKAGIYGSLAARLARRPMVWHLRDRLATDYLPRFAVACLRLVMARVPDVVLCNSETTRATLGPTHRSAVISMADPVRSEIKDHRHLVSDSFVVGIVGRLAPWKGQDVFLRAFAEAFPSRDAHAVIVGGPLFGAAEVAYADELKELARHLGVTDRVTFTGHVNDVAVRLQGMDVLVHASIIPEPFGQVIVEGMSAGLPVVASRGGGPEEIISDGVDGLLFPRGDHRALGALMRMLEEDRSLRDRLGQAGQRRAAAFSPEHAASELMEVYALAQAIAHGRK